MDYEYLRNHNFDVDGAVERFAGKTDLYDKYIKLFTEEDSYFNLEDAVANLDYVNIESRIEDIDTLFQKMELIGISRLKNTNVDLKNGINIFGLDDVSFYLDENTIEEKALNLFKYVEEEFLLAKKMILKADS